MGQRRGEITTSKISFRARFSSGADKWALVHVQLIERTIVHPLFPVQCCASCPWAILRGAEMYYAVYGTMQHTSMSTDRPCHTVPHWTASSITVHFSVCHSEVPVVCTTPLSWNDCLAINALHGAHSILTEPSGSFVISKVVNQWC
jgi:hypothetical protein